MEEIIKELFEQNALLRNGSIKLTKSLAEIQIPSTVQAVLASRIDRLPPPSKDLLQALAVIGKEFPLGLVRRVVRNLTTNCTECSLTCRQPSLSTSSRPFQTSPSCSNMRSRSKWRTAAWEKILPSRVSTFRLVSH
jgi:predicted ATPase